MFQDPDLESSWLSLDANEISLAKQVTKPHK